MKRHGSVLRLWAVIGSVLHVWCCDALGQNAPPAVSILWPRQQEYFSAGVLIKIKVAASDVDGTVKQVRFFADTDLIGVVTNPPFNLIWQVRAHPSDFRTLKAVAVDDQGATAESAPITILVLTGEPPSPLVEIIAPKKNALFPAPATFDFAAEVLASVAGDAGPVEFIVDTNSIAIVDSNAVFTGTAPPSSVTVTNLAEGEHKLKVRFHGAEGGFCRCNWMPHTIRVVKLGVQSPSLTAAGQFQFQVVTSFPGTDMMIEASEDLVGWTPITTNRPSSNSFLFTESSPATNSQRFYRVVVPP